MASYPLFPLPVVLFPGALLPLHIFEPRYRVMIADCAQIQRFVLLPPGQESESPPPGTVGTIARIRAVEPLIDGRSNVAVSGEQRITLTALIPADRPYLVGEVTPLSDLDESPVTSADVARLLVLGERYIHALSTITETDPDADLAIDPGTLTFQLASLTEWDFPTKQQFLALRSSRERVEQLLAALPALLDDVEARAATHRGARLNGKGKHHP